MSSCPGPSCGFALSKCKCILLGQSSSGSPLALARGKVLCPILSGSHLAMQDMDLLSFRAASLHHKFSCMLCNTLFTRLQLYGLVLLLLTKAGEPFSRMGWFPCGWRPYWEGLEHAGLCWCNGLPAIFIQIWLAVSWQRASDTPPTQMRSCLLFFFFGGGGGCFRSLRCLNI